MEESKSDLINLSIPAEIKQPISEIVRKKRKFKKKRKEVPMVDECTPVELFNEQLEVVMEE